MTVPDDRRWQLRTGYDRLAPVWDICTTAFFNVTNRSQAGGLHLIEPGQRVLMIGGGTGKFLKQLLQTAPPASVDYIDISPAMIKHARAKIGQTPNRPKDEEGPNPAPVRFITGTVEDLPPVNAPGYDLVCLNFYWDQFSPGAISSQFRTILDHTAPTSRWYITDFVHNRGMFNAAFVKLLYLFFRFFGVRTRALPDIFGFMENRSEKIFERKYWPGIVHCQFILNKYYTQPYPEPA